MQKIGDIPNTRADSNGEFTDGNVAGGTPPTILPAEWFNTIQRELINVLVAGGVTPDTTKFNQLTTAISKLITDGGFLKTTNNLSEIKNAGQAAVAQTLANLGLGEVIAAAADALKKSANLSDLTNKPLARENIGLPGVLENYARSDTFRVTDTASRVVSPTGKFFVEVGDAGSLLFYDTAKNKEIFKVIPTGEITVGSIKASSVTGLREFGVSQRWKDVSGQRGYGVTYTNASALPIMICIEFQSPASTTNVVNVNGVVAGGVNTSSAQPQIGFIVTVVPPNGEYVLIRILGTSTTVTRWSELS